MLALLAQVLHEIGHYIDALGVLVDEVTASWEDGSSQIQDLLGSVGQEDW